MRSILCLGLACVLLPGCAKTTLTDFSTTFTMEAGDSKAFFLDPVAQERTVTARWSADGGGIDGYMVTAANENAALAGMDERSRPNKSSIVSGCEAKDKTQHEFTFTAKANQGYALVLHRSINGKGPKSLSGKAEIQAK